MDWRMDWEPMASQCGIPMSLENAEILYDCSDSPGLEIAVTDLVIAPLLDEVDSSFHSIVYNGSFMNANIFRQDAGPNVDAAWQSLGVDCRFSPFSCHSRAHLIPCTDRALPVPEPQAKASGLRPEQVRINPRYGGGYPANVEGLHHLHCLNLLRKALYWNYDYYHDLGTGAFVNEDTIVKLHVTHCLDILRQRLMCQPDTGVMGQIWWDPDEPKAFVDFNTEHKCRNFEGIRRWAE